MCIVRPGPTFHSSSPRFSLGYNIKLRDKERKMKADYNHAKINFEGGLLEITFNTDGGPLLWSGAVHDELAELFGEISRNPDIRVR